MLHGQEALADVTCMRGQRAFWLMGLTRVGDVTPGVGARSTAGTELVTG